MPTLVITVNGPFAYINNFPLTRWVTLMAPMCPQHTAGISSIEPDNQFLLTGNSCNHQGNFGGCIAHRYELRFNPGYVPSSKWIGGMPLPCPTPANDYDPKKWRFWLSLPAPDVFAAINPVPAQIIKPEVTVTDEYPIGVRFIYKEWDGKNIHLFADGKEAKEFKVGDYEDDHMLLEIEYSGPVRDDPDHEDAVSCFENIMRGLELPWSIYFPTPKPSLFVTKQNDCLAAVAGVGFPLPGSEHR
jgi:hypothetical protein